MAYSVFEPGLGSNVKKRGQRQVPRPDPLLVLIMLLALVLVASDRENPTRSETRSPSRTRSPKGEAPTGQRFLPSLGCWMPPEKSLQDAAKGHAPGPETNINICQRRNRNAASASLDVKLEDDSIAKERHQLQLRRRQGRWVVVQDDHLQRCHQGRGHQDFSKEMCV